VLLVVPASTHETLASGGTAPSSRSQVASFCPTVSDRRFIDEEVWEVTNTAVVASQRGRGAGRAFVERAVDGARAAGARRLVLATGAADVGNLRFYQRCGFRMTHVVQDVFTPENGYPPGLEVDGIPLLDQVWFERVL
jgi:GNAT superfamily N-acetyltransferase